MLPAFPRLLNSPERTPAAQSMLMIYKTSDAILTRYPVERSAQNSSAHTAISRNTRLYRIPSSPLAKLSNIILIPQRLSDLIRVYLLFLKSTADPAMFQYQHPVRRECDALQYMRGKQDRPVCLITPDQPV